MVEGENDEENQSYEEGLLTFDQSMIEEDPNKQTEDADVDEMFLVNQIKSQYIKRTMRLLRFIQLLCEGQNAPLQNYLRVQVQANGEVNHKSFDFISYIAQMLGVFEKQYINCYSCQLTQQMIETLKEVIQGPCKENQRRLVEAKSIDCCRDLI